LAQSFNKTISTKLIRPLVAIASSKKFDLEFYCQNILMFVNQNLSSPCVVIATSVCSLYRYCGKRRNPEYLKHAQYSVVLFVATARKSLN